MEKVVSLTKCVSGELDLSRVIVSTGNQKSHLVTEYLYILRCHGDNTTDVKLGDVNDLQEHTRLNDSDRRRHFLFHEQA